MRGAAGAVVSASAPHKGCLLDDTRNREFAWTQRAAGIYNVMATSIQHAPKELSHEQQIKPQGFT